MKKQAYLLLLTLSAFMTTGFAHSGFYLGVGAGYAKMQGTPKPVDKSLDVGARLYAGIDYAINTKVALSIEGGYGRYGEAKLINQGLHYTMKNSGVDALGTVSYALTPTFSLVGKGGVMYERFSVTGKDIDTKAYKPEIVGGVKWSPSDHFALLGTYGHVFGNNLDDDIHTKDRIGTHDVPSLDSVMLSAQLTF